MISTKRLFIALLGLLLCCGIECVAEDIFSTPLMTTVQRDYPSARAVRSGTSVRAATTTAPAATGTSYSVLPSTNTLFNKQSASSTYAVGGGFGGGASTAFGGRRTASASVDAGGFSDGLFVASQVPLGIVALVVVIDLGCRTCATFSCHHRAAFAAEQLGG